MKRITLAALGMFAIASLAIGCHKDEPQQQTASTTGATSATAQPSALAAASEDIPTEEDFQDEAQQKVTDQNMSDELDKLEKEIGQ